MNNDKLKEKYKLTKLRDKIKLSSKRVKYNSTNQDDEDNNASSYANNVLEDAVSNTSASDCHPRMTITRWFIPTENQSLSVSMEWSHPVIHHGLPSVFGDTC